jgi:hypothetical protein
MMSILFIGVVTALVGIAILAKTCVGESKRAEKQDKGEIIKQLLALSDRQNIVAAIASVPPRNLRPTSTPTTRSDKLCECTASDHNSKRSYSPVSPSPPTSLRTNQSDAEIEEQIRQRAYELYQRRGGGDGNATDDWLQAREEVLSFEAKAKTSP